MNSSLRDQLLAAGLVTEKQARKAAQEEQQRHFRKQGPVQTRPQGKPQQQPSGPHASGQQRSDRQQPYAQQPQSQQSATPQPGTQAPPPAPSAKLQAQQAQAAKIARDKELNRRREDKAQRKARMAEIELLIEQNRVPRLETEDFYSFMDGKKVRRMSVDAQRREQLTNGQLAIVRYKGFYAVVPAAIAERIRERDANMVVPTTAKVQTPSDADDPYKDFVVPDDLTW